MEADGARCTGKEGGGSWRVACGEPVGGDGGEDRVAVKATKAANGFIGVVSSTASREMAPGCQEGGIGLSNFTGSLWVNSSSGGGQPIVKGFGDGDTLGAAVLRDGGGRVVAFYVNGE